MSAYHLITAKGIAIFNPILCSCKPMIKTLNLIKLKTLERLSMYLFNETMFRWRIPKKIILSVRTEFNNVENFRINKHVMIVLVKRHFYEITTVLKNHFYYY